MPQLSSRDGGSRVTILVTGGAGFIGSTVVRRLVRNTDARVVNVDKLTYAGNLDSLDPVANHPRYQFERLDIADARGIRQVFETYKPSAVVHLAAESHVDRSIDAPAEFIHTNIVGTFVLLQEARRHWMRSDAALQEHFRFLHVSTDEVFGSLGPEGHFREDTPYRPNSPYSASKAAADHLVRAWHHTYGLPCLLTNCSNNYGPFQFPEKLIPLIILNALEGKALPVYGRGENVRDWLFVDDHAEAIHRVLTHGHIGETYAIGGRCEQRNIDVVRAICRILDRIAPRSDVPDRTSLIEFVEDRPGHDLRYAIDPSKIMSELAWRPRETFTTGLERTISWYMTNRAWWERVRSGVYQGERLGLAVR